MNPAVRSFLVVLLGLVAASVTVFVTESLGHLVYPVPAGLDFKDKEGTRAYVESLPTGAKLFVLLGWTLGSFAGGWTTAKWAGRRPGVHGAVFGALFLAVCVTNLFMIPHPVWFAVGTFALVPAAAFVGVRLAAPRATL